MERYHETNFDHLLTLARDGDQLALNEIFRRKIGWLQKHVASAWKAVANQRCPRDFGALAVHDEIFDDLFRVLSKTLAPPKGQNCEIARHVHAEAHFNWFARRVIKGLAIDAMRTAGTEARRSLKASRLRQRVAPDSASVVLRLQETRERIDRAIHEHLLDHERQVIIQFLDGERIPEIAINLKESIRTIRNWQNTAVNKLRRALIEGLEASKPLKSTGLRRGCEVAPGVFVVKRCRRGSAVWKVLHQGKPLALKVLTPATFGALHELTILCTGVWDHPHIVQGTFLRHAGRQLILMKWADKDLADVLDESEAKGQGGLPIGEAIGYLKPIAAALDFLNRGSGICQLIHGDVKLENILLLENIPKLTDFSYTRRVQDGLSRIIGTTPDIASPESLAGMSTVHTDQFSLAAAYCELRTGHKPYAFGGQCLFDKPDLSGLISREREVVRRALSCDPTQRWDSCSTFVGSLEHVRDASSSFIELGQSSAHGADGREHCSGRPTGARRSAVGEQRVHLE